MLKRYKTASILLSAIFFLSACNSEESSSDEKEFIDTPSVVSTNNKIDNKKYDFIPQDINRSVAIRFLNKTTFGATEDSIEELQKYGVVGWLDKQLSIPLDSDIYLKKTIELAKDAEPDNNPFSLDDYLKDNDKVFNKNVASFHSLRFMQSAWFTLALNAKDQLRHKVAYALSQIIVESDFEPIFTRRGEALSRYFDILYANAFKSYKSLLTDISFNSGMGLFLTFNGNKKVYKNEAGVYVYPDENYAREIMQLFSIGLNELNIDATPKKDKDGNLIPTYTQTDVNELARVFTGWDLKRSGSGDENKYDKYGRVGFKRGDFTHPLEFTKEYHDYGSKSLLGSTIDANLSAEDDIKRAIDIIMKNQNVAPFISKNLILRLTKSNPSPDYVKRVATKFVDSDGDLKEVIKAIFLDEEIWNDIVNNNIVKAKEPLIAYTNFLRMVNIKTLPYWYFCGYGKPTDDKASNCQKVENKLLFNNPTDYLGQGAGRAPTVFNFYDNSYVPNNDKFKESNSVAPELQIQDDTVLIKFNNRVRKAFDYDLIYILSKKKSDGSRYKNLDDYLASAPKDKIIPLYYVGADKYMIDISKDYNFLEKEIDGDTDGDFKNLKDKAQDGNLTLVNNAVKKYIDYVDNKLTGGIFSSEEKNIIYEELTKKFIYNHWADDDTKFAKQRQIMNNVIRPIYRYMVTSDKFMTE